MLGLWAIGQEALGQIEFTEDVTESRWHEAWSEPVRTRIALKASQQQFFATTWVDTTNIVARWWSPLSEPVRQPRGSRAVDRQFFTTTWVQTIDTDRWFVPLREPQRQSLFRVADQQFFATTWVDTENVEARWHYAWSEPVRTKSGLLPAQQQFFATTWVPPATANRWFMPLREPQRGLAFRTADQQTLAYVRVPDFLVHWIWPWRTPQREKPGLLAAEQMFHMAHTIVPPFASRRNALKNVIRRERTDTGQLGKPGDGQGGGGRTGN